MKKEELLSYNEDVLNLIDSVVSKYCVLTSHDLVNAKIGESLPVTLQELSLEDAKTSGATGSFHDRYGDTVKIFTIGDPGEPFSREICGGPHASNTADLKSFKIKKEESSSAGVRRIKAVIGQ